MTQSLRIPAVNKDIIRRFVSNPEPLIGSPDGLGLGVLPGQTGSCAIAGSIPLGLGIAGSDLDILMQAPDLDLFAAGIREGFAARWGAILFRSDYATGPAVVVRFSTERLSIELFVQAHPIEEQWAYRHMLVEARLLHLAEPAFGRHIHRLKRDGMKTEPAFTAALGYATEQDPYGTLLGLESYSDAELVLELSRNGWQRAATGPYSAASLDGLLESVGPRTGNS